MRHLIRRSLREIRATKAQFLSIILIIAVGSAIFSGLFSTITVLKNFLADYYDTYQMADTWVYVKALTQAEVEVLQADFEPLTIEPRAFYEIESVLKGEAITYRFYAPTTINAYKLEAGSHILHDQEVILDQSFALTNQLNIQDVLSIKVDGEIRTYTIVGLFNSPEFAYKSVDFSDPSSNKQGFGILIASQATLLDLNHHSSFYLEAKATLETELADAQTSLDGAHQTLMDAQSALDDQKDLVSTKYASMPPILSMALAKLEDAQTTLNQHFDDYTQSVTDFEDSKSEAMVTLNALPGATFELLVSGDESSSDRLIHRLKAQGKYVQTIEMKDHPSYSMVNNILKPIEVMTTIFPILFFMVAAIIILISMSKTIENERTQIAILKGLGMSWQTITLNYLFYGWWAALIGSLPFAILGNFVIPTVLINIFTTRFSLPQMNVVYYPLYIILAIGMAFFFASMAILLAIRPILREIPAQGMRPKVPKSTQRSLLEKWPWFWNRRSYTQKLIIRNILMGKLKLVLSSIGIVGAISLLITGLSLQYSAAVMIGNNMDAFRFAYAIGLEEDTKLSDLELPIELEKAEGHQQLVAKLGEYTVSLQLMKVHQSLYEMKDIQGKVIDVDSDAVVITQILHQIYGYEVGDTMTLKVEDQTIDLIITDISNQYLGKDISLSFDHAQRLGIVPDVRTYYVSTLDNQVSQTEVDQLLATSGIQSVDTQAKFQARANEMMEMLNRIIYIIVLSALILSITVIYNLASINIFERRRELATLRVLGYTIKEVGHLVYVENYLLLFLGMLGGVPAGIFLSQTIARLVSTPEFLMKDEVNGQIVFYAIVAVFFFTFLTNRLLSLKLKKIEFVESLKGVE